MDSPVRKMLKRNDYNRHKLLRKIRRLRRAEVEQQKVAAEKELKRRLRVTPPKFGDGKEPTLLDADKVRMNKQGLFLDEAGNIVGDSVVLPELTVRAHKGYKSAYNAADAFEFAGSVLNSPAALADYAYNRFVDAGKGELNTDYRNGTPVLSALDIVGKTVSPTRWIGSVRSGFEESPWSENNPGLWGDENLDLLTDILTAPKAIKGVGKGAAKGTKMYGKLLKKSIDMAKTAQEDALMEYYKTHPEDLFVDRGVHKGPVVDTSTDLSRTRRTFIRKPNLSIENIGADGYVVPEEQYGYLKPRVTFNLEDGLPIVKMQSSGDVTRIKPQYGQMATSGWNVGDIVDENGNINTAYAASALRAAMDLAKKRSGGVHNHWHNRGYRAMDPESLGAYSPIFMDVPNLQSTLRHLYSSAKSAKSAPVAKGSTKQMQVFNALSHDVGELTGRDAHATESALILKQMFGNSIPLDDLKTIQHHMDLDVIFSGNPKLQALKFADMASGVPYDEYIANHPEQGFAKQTPIENVFKPLPGETTRDVVKNRINPVLKAYGYDVLPLDASESEQKQLLFNTILKHRSLLRGLSDPLTDSSKLYRQEVDDATKKYFNIPSSTKDLRIQYAATHVTDRSRSHGEMGLQEWRDQLNLSDNIHANYNSNSSQVASGYASSGGRAVRVLVPFLRNIDNMSLVDMWQYTDFPLYGVPATYGAYAETPLSADYDYKLPYRLHTGRSLKQDTLKKYGSEIDDITEKQLPNIKISDHPSVQHAKDNIFGPQTLSDELFEQVASDGTIQKAPVPIELPRSEQHILLLTKENVGLINEAILLYCRNTGDEYHEFKPRYTKNGELIGRAALGRTANAAFDLGGIEHTKQEILQTLNPNQKLTHYVTPGKLQLLEGMCQRIVDKANMIVANHALTEKLAAYLDYAFRPIMKDLLKLYWNNETVHESDPQFLKLKGRIEKFCNIALSIADNGRKNLKYTYLKNIDLDFKVLERAKKSVMQKRLKYKSMLVDRLLPTYYANMLKQTGIHPMHETDYVQTHPLIFTTEDLRPNVTKASRTKAGTSRRSKNLGYQHYIFPAPVNTKVTDFVGFEDFAKRKKDSRHKGSVDPESSKKVR